MLLDLRAVACRSATDVVWVLVSPQGHSAGQFSPSKALPQIFKHTFHTSDVSASQRDGKKLKVSFPFGLSRLMN